VAPVIVGRGSTAHTKNGSNETGGGSKDSPNPSNGLEGYAYVFPELFALGEYSNAVQHSSMPLEGDELSRVVLDLAECGKVVEA
jgi:hypothetical protein